MGYILSLLVIFILEIRKKNTIQHEPNSNINENYNINLIFCITLFYISNLSQAFHYILAEFFH